MVIIPLTNPLRSSRSTNRCAWQHLFERPSENLALGHPSHRAKKAREKAQVRRLRRSEEKAARMVADYWRRKKGRAHLQVWRAWSTYKYRDRLDFTITYSCPLFPLPGLSLSSGKALRSRRSSRRVVAQPWMFAVFMMAVETKYPVFHAYYGESIFHKSPPRKMKMSWIESSRCYGLCFCARPYLASVFFFLEKIYAV